MGAALDNLKARLVTEAGNLDNAILQLEVLADIDVWYACRGALDTFRSTDVQSYSISGRSFSRKNLSELEASERRLYARIMDALFMAGCSNVDLRGNESDSWPA